MSKDIWFQEFERLCNEGDNPDKAYKDACNKVDKAYADRLADMADHARMLRKEGQS
jgi:hypothetical protein